jgi:RND family efflux transporter MFP subunit
MNDTENKNGRGGSPDTGAASKKSRRGPILLGSCVLALILASGASFGLPWLGRMIHYVGTDDAALQCESVSVSATTSGRLAQMLVAEGDRVGAGQVLARLEDGDLRAQKAQAATALVAAERQVELAKLSLDAARKDADRVRLLASSGAASKEQSEHAAEGLDSARAQYAIAQAEVDDARARAGVIENELADFTIRSPISGVVAQKNLAKGDVVQSGQTIYTINDLDELWVVAKFEETKIARIKAGAPVAISVDAYRGRISGKVALRGAGIVDPPFAVGDFTKTTQRVPVRITLDSQHEGLVPGLSAEVEVRTEPLVKLPFGLLDQ